MHSTRFNLCATILFLAAPVLAQSVNFNAPRMYGYSTYGVYSTVVADFNGDGKPDLASGLTGAVEILLGNGDGTFRSLNSLDVGLQTNTYLTVGDFNGDGKPDLMVGGEYNYVSILLGNGDAPFGSQRHTSLESSRPTGR